MQELAARLSSLIVLAYPLVRATPGYLFDKFWDVWVGECALFPSFEEELGDLADEIHYEPDILELSEEKRDRLVDMILTRVVAKIGTSWR